MPASELKPLITTKQVRSFNPLAFGGKTSGTGSKNIAGFPLRHRFRFIRACVTLTFA